ncbi:MAG: VanZ family protein [Betaproteobacteria bacterium]|nr:VanZ family protein [Betaproteobacteria bacterium]
MTARWRWGALAVAVWAIASLMHLRFSLWLVVPHETAFGKFALADLVPAAAAAGGAVLLFAIALQLRRAPHPRLAAGYWIAWAAAVVAMDSTLTFSPNEWAHYPQYALVAWLLARAVDPSRYRRCVGRLLFWSTLLGAGDELLQYLWIAASYGQYFDFNDCLANLVGASGGLLLYYGAAPVRPRDSSRSLPLAELVTVTALAIVMAVTMNAGPVSLGPPPHVAVPPGGVVRMDTGTWHLYLQRSASLYGSWQPGQRHARYYVLPPVTGLGLMLAAGVLFSGLGWRRTMPPQGGNERK